jgi:hypothetical protein
MALRSDPALAVVQFDLPEKTEAYEIIRRRAQGWRLRRRHQRLGDRYPKPAAARRNLIGSACQDAGFHASFSPAWSLL